MSPSITVYAASSRHHSRRMVTIRATKPTHKRWKSMRSLHFLVKGVRFCLQPRKMEAPLVYPILNRELGDARQRSFRRCADER